MKRTNTPLYKNDFYHGIEVITVLFMAFGLFIYSSTVSFLENTQTPKVQDFNSFDFYFIVFFELAALTIIYLILKKRKWKIQNLNLDFRINMVFVALVLVVIRLLFVYVVDNANLLSVWALPKPEITLSAGIFSMVLMVIVNSVFEEVILIGYLFKSLERWPVAIVILFSLLIRVSFHTYQGIEELTRIIILGVVLGLYYSTYKKLWPVILAHGIGNLIYFLNDHYNWVAL